MAEEQTTDTESPIEEECTPVLAEFQALGQGLALAFKALWEHQDSRRLRHELHEGFVELGRQIDTAVQSAQESEAAQQFGAQIRETMERARETDVTSKVEEGVLTGLRELNTQVSRFVRSLESHKGAKGEVDSETDAEG